MGWVIRLFGLKGSWKWACRRMREGHKVKMKSAVAVHNRLDLENQGRIQWSFNGRDWEDAKVFLGDLEATDWEVFSAGQSVNKSTGISNAYSKACSCCNNGWQGITTRVYPEPTGDGKNIRSPF